MFAGSKTVSSERNDYIMKATGIVRRIDDLGRVVIPKEKAHRLKYIQV